MSGRELDADGTDSYHPEHPWEQAGHPLYIQPDRRTKGNWPPVRSGTIPAGPHEEREWASLPERGGWEQIYPKSPRVPTSGEVELMGGPRDGERRAVPDIDTPLVFTEFGGQLVIESGILDSMVDGAAGPLYVYRRRVVGPDEPEPMPIRFDYQVPIPLP